MTKMTYVDALNTALTFVDGEVADKLTALRDQLVKRNTADHKPTKTQKENAETKSAILRALGDADKPMTATEVMVACGLPSNQKASALLKQLVDAHEVARVVDGRKTTFTLPDCDGVQALPNEITF